MLLVFQIIAFEVVVVNCRYYYENTRSWQVNVLTGNHLFETGLQKQERLPYTSIFFVLIKS